jgi:hypothetical protein
MISDKVMQSFVQFSTDEVCARCLIVVKIAYVIFASIFFLSLARTKIKDFAKARELS